MEIYLPQFSRIEECLAKAKTETEKYEIEIEKENDFVLRQIKKYANGVQVSFSNSKHLESLYAKGDFITAYFPANRKTQIIRVQGV